MPDTNNVYVVPDINVDLFFWDGWWWRPWEGRWYRSQYYNQGWSYYNNVPSFYYDVDPRWRGYYRDHNWYGHRWNYERIPDERLQQNWKSWNNNRYWENQRTWGVQGYHPRPQQQRQELRQQRQQQYQSSQRFSDISNRWSNKNIPRLTNLKVNHTINPRFSNLMGNSNPDNSILNLRASNTRWNQSTSSTKEGLKEKIQNTRSRSIIANGDIRKLWPSSWFGMSRVSQLS